MSEASVPAQRTVAAVSTPPGEGGIGVIRISGEHALNIADRCFRSFSGERLSELGGYRALYGRVFDGEQVLDDAVALVFRAPKSYTGEDVVELSVHGGRLMVQSVLRVVLSCGASPAERGEFSKRAYLNGKLDLAQAESIMGLISAGNEAALRISRAAKSGRVSREIEGLCDRLTALAADFAAYSDFPDEEFPELSVESFLPRLSEISARLARLIADYDAGRVVREGIDCAIVGRPNVGKSTLMNLLSGCERSIVTDLEGTTRDVIEETVTLGGLSLRLADTAGLRDTGDAVERVGVERARQRMENADLILAVFDGSAPLCAEDFRLLEALRRRPAVAVLNKADRGICIDRAAFGAIPCAALCAKTGEGIDRLSALIAETAGSARLDPAAAVLTSERQRDCAVRAQRAADEALTALREGCTPDAAAVCVDDALAALLELTGKRVVNEVTDEVFRRFCVGK